MSFLEVHTTPKRVQFHPRMKTITTYKGTRGWRVQGTVLILILVTDSIDGFN